MLGLDSSVGKIGCCDMGRRLCTEILLHLASCERKRKKMSAQQTIVHPTHPSRTYPPSSSSENPPQSGAAISNTDETGR